MRFQTLSIIFAISTVVSACNTVETVEFSPTAYQSAITRDGIPAIVSKQKSSIVLFSPSQRGEPANGRVAFTLALNNMSDRAKEFHISDIQISQRLSDGSEVPLQVIPYDQLVTEERQRQVAVALLTGIAVGANSYAAAHAGYGTVNGSVYTPNGTATYSGTYYNPTAAAIAQNNANYQNEAMIENTIAAGQRNMSELDKVVLKDNTVLPHEWLGGRVIISAPIAESDKPKAYNVKVKIGDEWHSIDVNQHKQG